MMNTLADELLADLDEDDQVKEEDEKIEEGEDVLMDDGDEDIDARLRESLKDNDIHKVAHLLSSSRFKTLLERIEAQPANRTTEVIGLIEEDPEYKLLVESNVIVAEINNEIQVIHKYIRDNYAAKFPELESLVVNPLDYARVVQRIGNQTVCPSILLRSRLTHKQDMTQVEFTDILPAATIMVVSVAASTTTGKILDEVQLTRVMDACQMALDLDVARSKLLAFVESRMTFIAPNLSALVGSAVAARLIAAAGGLKSLAKIPACNIMLLGAPKRQLSGFSSTHSRRCMAGYIRESDIIKTTPPSYQLKGLRFISNKVVLASRMDAEHTCMESPLGTDIYLHSPDPDGEEGRKLHDLVLKKLEKLQEPPPPKLAKPLAAPDDKPKKRRGGARVRRNKEKFAVTDLRKHANRMSFGVAEEEESSSGRGLGMIGAPGSGKVRLTAQEKNLLKKQKQAGAATPGLATSGLATSLAFTPVLGLELGSAQETAAAKAEEIKALNNKYFSQGNFFKVKKQKTDN